MFLLRNTDPRTVDGELLWAQRLPEATVKELEKILGEFGTAGQLQQHPTPRGGGIVRREHFRFYHRADLPQLHEQFDLMAISVDAAFKDVATSSYVVVQAWGRIAPYSYLLGQVRERLSFSKTCTAIDDMKTRFPGVSSVLIEDKANGPAIIDVLSSKIPGVLPIEPIGSKNARAEASAPLIQAGNVILPEAAEEPWVEGFISEWCAVPTNAFWDQVDASGQYLLKYGRFVGVDLRVGAAVSDMASVAEDTGSPWSLYGR